MTVVVLENQVAEEQGFLVLFELHFDIGLTGPLRFGVYLVGDRAVGLNDGELVVLVPPVELRVLLHQTEGHDLARRAYHKL